MCTRGIKAGCIWMVCILSAICADAQVQNLMENPDRTFYGGLVLGGNMTQVDGDTYAGYYKIGINAGAIVYTRFTDEMAASLEILYSQKGSRGINVTSSPYVGEYIEKYFLDLNYVEVPLLLNYFQRGSRLNYNIGASYSYLIGSSERLETDQPPVVFDPSIFTFRKADFDLVVGIGYKVWKGWFLNARFQYSIFSIRDADKIPIGFGTHDQYNNMMVVRLVYVFNSESTY
ncbi:MAG: porin family protein [Bacteroidota bacterium]